MTAPTYVETVVAVGRMLKPKAGEPRVHQWIKGNSEKGFCQTVMLEPGTGRFEGATVWPRDAA